MKVTFYVVLPSQLHRIIFFSHQEEREDEEREQEDTVNELAGDMPSMPSFVSANSGSNDGPDMISGPHSGVYGVKRMRAERQSSVSSVMSDDSFEMIEEAGRVAGSAVGLSRMNSVG